MVKPRSPKGRAREVTARLAAEYPGTAKDLCALDHETPFQLLVATILSAQCTDERVNMVTPAVFARFPTPASLAEADPRQVEELIRPTGFFRNKTRSLIGMARATEDRFGGEVPSAIDDLTSLPGVGRKTANVIRGVAFGLPGLPVDTHVGRLSRRLGLTGATDPVKAELDLNALVPPAQRAAFSLRLILHGRRVCVARRPRCEACLLADFCPSAELPERAPAKAAAPAGRGGGAQRPSTTRASRRVAPARARSTA
ncbi:MAG TPA: endonuclease III [Acidimicrobiales bacterium]